MNSQMMLKGKQGRQQEEDKGEKNGHVSFDNFGPVCLSKILSISLDSSARAEDSVTVKEYC